MQISVEKALLSLMKNPSYFNGIIPVNSYTAAWQTRVNSLSAQLLEIVPTANISNKWPHKITALPWLAFQSIGGTGKAEMGYNVNDTRRRWKTGGWQVSVFVKQKEDGEQAIDLLDQLFICDVPGVLYGSHMTNDPDGYDQDPDRWHFPPRWECQYQTIDQ